MPPAWPPVPGSRLLMSSGTLPPEWRLWLPVLPATMRSVIGAMGFCLINNVAVAAAHLVDRGERVLIVDWDVHHGNGTQALFWDEPNVLYVSTHQWPAYPGTGRSTEAGGQGAYGLTVNAPLPPAATGAGVRHSLDEVAAPA